MKFVDVARLSHVTSLLDNCTEGDRRLRGRVECYSCKMAGDDKKLHRELGSQYQEEGNADAQQFPLGSLADVNNRRLLINLICTLNATFPDYDFRSVRPDQFVRENLGIVINAINVNLSEIIVKQYGSFMDELWEAINQEIDLRNCDVLSYIPRAEEESPFSVGGAIWSFNYFFHNAHEKKLIFFTCCCTTRAGGSDFFGLAREDDELESSDQLSTSDDDENEDREEEQGEMLAGRSRLEEENEDQEVTMEEEDDGKKEVIILSDDENDLLAGGEDEEDLIDVDYDVDGGRATENEEDEEEELM